MADRVLWQTDDALSEANLATVAARANQTDYVERGLKLVPDWEAGTLAIGAGYAVVLGWFTGAVGLSAGAATGLDVVLLPPWWGPMVRYDGPLVSLFLFPYRAVGYGALAYLVSLAARDVAEYGSSAGVGGLIALGSCASCALPLVAAVGSALGGVGLGFGATPAAGGGTYLLATIAYVLSVGVLTVRPAIAGS